MSLSSIVHNYGVFQQGNATVKVHQHGIKFPYPENTEYESYYAEEDKLQRTVLIT